MNPFARKDVPAGEPSPTEIKTAVRVAIADVQETDAATIEAPIPPEVIPAEELKPNDDRIKLSKLIDEDFPFDESQVEAIEGMIQELFACLTGAAGTGKTTCTKKLVDRLLSEVALDAVNMAEYWKKAKESGAKDDPDEEYEAPEQFVPSVAIVSFTGRATQMIKKNFPSDWHGNIMTIHRMLGFYPEFYDEWDDDSGDYRKKMRFVPSYDESFKLPWDIIIIDEAGMLGVDLWHMILAAMKPGCRVYFIGDINQLPPVHGRSVFGFAMAKWPSWELTHIHRQQGKDNPIVDNAWRVLHGKMPVSEGRFQMIELKGDANFSSRQVRAMLPKLKERGVFDPIRDACITPINGEDGSRGYALGQLPLNREFALIFNPKSEDNPRYIIDGGRERKQFAVGDKVMATRNDWEAGITNGMTGVITEITENGGYSGDRRHFGRVEDIQRYMQDEADELDGPDPADFDLESLTDSFDKIEQGAKNKREKRDRGPSSHIVTVRFGADEHAIEIPFASLAEVGSLMTAYVVTCHKMQGGEAPVVVIIVHDSHKAMLYREWLYTAITRASHMCILLHSQTALKAALNKQKIKGATLQDKVRAFNQWQSDEGLLGAATYVNLPESESTGHRIMERKALAVTTPRELTTEAEKRGGLASLLAKKQAQQAEYQGEIPKPAAPEIHVVHVHTRETIVIRESKPEPKLPVDGGTVNAEVNRVTERMERIKREQAAIHAGKKMVALVSQKPKHLMLTGPKSPALLTYQPVAIQPEPVKPKNPFANLARAR